MDGQLMTKNQDIVSRAEKSLATAEAAIGDVLCDMIKNPYPYSDDGCNAAHQGSTEELASIYFGLTRWHRGARDCVEMGDPTVQFGGK